MLPFEISHLAQERCKELRGETRAPTEYFKNNLRLSLARLLHDLGRRLESKPTPQFSQKTTES
jgi:hypothetical protein